MLQDFQNHLQLKFPYLNTNKMLLAVSGGVDSMVLLDLFRNLNYNIHVAHCNFNLRDKESDLDQKLIEDYCSKFDIKLHVNSFNTINYSELNKVSIQIAARELRYNWFYELLGKNDYDYLVTGHHLDDSVETFLINFTRGTGIEGLLGVPEKNNKILRPLLNFSRDQIQEYAINNHIVWREDASNATTKYLRNKIRHDVVPVFKDKNPDFLNSFQQTLSNLSDSYNLIQDACDFVAKQVFLETDYILEIDIKKLKEFKNYKAYLYQWLKNYNFKSWNDIYDLVDAESGKKVISDNYLLLKNRNSLILNDFQISESEEFLIFENENNVLKPISLIFENINEEFTSVQDSNEIILDKEKLNFPLTIRKWKEGDYFFPIGMKGSKKVSKYFKDEKFSLFDKNETWLLVNNSSEIIWIIDHRMDDRFKITKQSKNIIKITLN